MLIIHDINYSPAKKFALIVTINPCFEARHKGTSRQTGLQLTKLECLSGCTNLIFTPLITGNKVCLVRSTGACQ